MHLQATPPTLPNFDFIVLKVSFVQRLLYLAILNTYWFEPAQSFTLQLLLHSAIFLVERPLTRCVLCSEFKASLHTSELNLVTYTYNNDYTPQKWECPLQFLLPLLHQIESLETTLGTSSNLLHQQNSTISNPFSVYLPHFCRT